MYSLLFSLAALLILAGCGNKSNLTPSQHQSLHQYNQKPSLKPRQQRQMHRLHRIDEQKARAIATRLTGEQVIQLSLRHTGSILFYFIKTAHHELIIDAMDGALLKKVSHD